MDKNEKIRLTIGLIINVIVFGLGVFCLINFIGYAMRGDPDNRFRYFTNISNLSMALLSLISAILLSISLIKKKMIYPAALTIAKYMALTMTTLTFFTVLFVLAPITGFIEMYGKVRFITHLVIPVISFVSFLFFEDKTVFKWQYSLFAMAPLLIYGAIYIGLAINSSVWPDIYEINKQGVWYLYAIAFIVANFLISQGIYFLMKRANKKAID